MKSKKANILTENVVFIVLNVVFFAIMLVFIYLQTSSVSLLEESYAKQIALLIDGSRTGTIIEINLKDFFEKAEKKGISRENSVVIDNVNNLVILKGSSDSFHEYSFFNNVNVNYNLDKNKKDFLILELK